MPVSSSNLRYNVNLRRKEAIVHSILDSQKDLQDIITEVTNFSETLDNLAGIKSPATRSLLDHINLSLYSVQAKLTRSIDITLAHSEEVHPSDISDKCPDPDDLPPAHLFPQDRLFLLPLQVEVLEDPNLGDINHLLNPSEYIPDDEEFQRSVSLVDCCFDHEPTVYVHSSETEHDLLSTNFCSPFKHPDELNKFYCKLPPPSDAPVNCPDKGNALDKTGNPFLKKLQVNNCLYSPSLQAFARVFRWNQASVQVEVISTYRSYTQLFQDPSSFSRFRSNWKFGDFCIALNHLQERKFLAYVSPFSRAESHPFPSDQVTATATLAQEPDSSKRKLN